MVRPSRASSEPTRAARSASDGSAPSSRRSCLARRFELAALTADAARPGVAAQRVDHRAADAPFGEGLELDAARLVEAVAPHRSDRACRPAPDRRARWNAASRRRRGARATRRTEDRRRCVHADGRRGADAALGLLGSSPAQLERRAGSRRATAVPQQKRTDKRIAAQRRCSVLSC